MANVASYPVRTFCSATHQEVAQQLSTTSPKCWKETGERGQAIIKYAFHLLHKMTEEGTLDLQASEQRIDRRILAPHTDALSRRITCQSNLIFIHCNRQKRNDEPLGRGAEGVVKSGFAITTDDKGRATIEQIAISTIRFSAPGKEISAESQKKLDTLKRVLTTIQHLPPERRAGILPIRHVSGPHAGKNGAQKLYVFMDLCPGGDLFGYLAQQLPLKEEVVHRWIYQIVEGLTNLHAAGIIHRDLKPENVLIDARGNLRICDFGFSVLETEEEEIEARGTPAYVAPELLLSKKSRPQKASDIYSTGILITTIALWYLAPSPETEARCSKLIGSHLDFCNKGIQELPPLHRGQSLFEEQTAYPQCLLAEMQKIDSKCLYPLAYHMLFSDPNRRISAREVLKRLPRPVAQLQIKSE